MGSHVQDRRSSINAGIVISDISDNVFVTEEDISNLASDVSTGSEIRSRRVRREKRTGGETMEIKEKRGRRKKKEYVADDFDFNIAYPGSQEEGGSELHPQ